MKRSRFRRSNELALQQAHSPNEAIIYPLRSIFVAIPKTGSTSIRSQLPQTGPHLIPTPHLTISQIRQLMGIWAWLEVTSTNRNFPTKPSRTLSEWEIEEAHDREFASFFKFSVVRNPWARVWSLYRRQEGIRVAKKMTFDAFCQKLEYSSDTCIHPTRNKNQLDWLTDSEGSLLVDFVLRLENLDADLQSLKEMAPQLSFLQNVKKNAGPPSREYREVFSDKAKTRISRLFQRDIDHFGFEF